MSVVVAAEPARGRLALERLAASHDAGLQWILRENLKKARLKGVGATWGMAAGQ